MSLLSHRPDPRSSSEKYSHVCSFYRILPFTQYLQQNRAYLTDPGPPTSINRNTRLIQKGETVSCRHQHVKTFTHSVFHRGRRHQRPRPSSRVTVQTSTAALNWMSTDTFTSVQIYRGGDGDACRDTDRQGRLRMSDGFY